jgi:hypothetical protein
LVALPLFGSGRAAIPPSQQDYYRSRAAEERDAAAGASDPELSELHARMARLFASLAIELDRPRHAIAPGW